MPSGDISKTNASRFTTKKSRASLASALSYWFPRSLSLTKRKVMRTQSSPLTIRAERERATNGRTGIKSAITLLKSRRSSETTTTR